MNRSSTCGLKEMLFLNFGLICNVWWSFADFKAAKATSNSTSSFLAAVSTIAFLKVSGDITLNGAVKTSPELWEQKPVGNSTVMKNGAIVSGNVMNLWVYHCSSHTTTTSPTTVTSDCQHLGSLHSYVYAWTRYSLRPFVAPIHCAHSPARNTP